MLSKPWCGFRRSYLRLDIREGKGPMYMRTDLAMQALAEGDPAKMEKVREEAWEDFLDMTIAQALTWGLPEYPAGDNSF